MSDSREINSRGISGFIGHRDYHRTRLYGSGRIYPQHYYGYDVRRRFPGYYVYASEYPYSYWFQRDYGRYW